MLRLGDFEFYLFFPQYISCLYFTPWICKDINTLSATGCICGFVFFPLCQASACTPHTAAIILSPKLSHGWRAMWYQTKPLITRTWIMGTKIPSRFLTSRKNIFAENNIFLKDKFPFLILFVVVHSNSNKNSVISLSSLSAVASPPLKSLTHKFGAL